MKLFLRLLNFVIRFIAVFVIASGIVLTGLGAFDFFHAFSHLDSRKSMLGLLAVGLLHSIDLFLMAIVFFVFALGILVLFNNNNNNTQNGTSLPQWLRIKNFTELKVILWEAILTTLVVSYIGGLVERRLDGEQLTTQHLIIPAAILLLAVSLYFLKRKQIDRD